MLWQAFVSIFALFALARVQSRVFDPCEFAQELTKIEYNVSFWQVPTWVCIAHHATGLNTSYNHFGFHGIFRLSGQHWCSECGLPCDKLTDNDIRDDVKCAVHTVYEKHHSAQEDGFSAWGTFYQNYCREPWKDLKLHDCHKMWKLVVLRLPTGLAGFVHPAAKQMSEYDEVKTSPANTSHNPTNETESTSESTWQLHHLLLTDAGFLLLILLFIMGIAAVIEAWRRYELPFTQICR